MIRIRRVQKDGHITISDGPNQLSITEDTAIALWKALKEAVYGGSYDVYHETSKEGAYYEKLVSKKVK